MIATTAEEKETLRVAGKHLAQVLRDLAKEVKPGVSVAYLNDKAEELIRAQGDRPALINYSPSGAMRPYPAALCVAVNDVVVHGIPTERNLVLQEGDIIGLDTVLEHEGLFVDSALTVPVGNINAKTKKLLEVTNEALYVGIEAAKVGNTVGDIGHAISCFVNKHGYGVVRDLCGHGVGKKVHEEPQVPNFGTPGKGEKLALGMVLALEPMLNLGTADVIFDDDGYTVRTADGQLSAHFEHTILITAEGPEILTER